MSSERGNNARKRAQKHQNRFAFKNDLHDTNVRTKRVNQLSIHGVCEKCKNILEWKIRYKKYKLLKTPSGCNKCLQKVVKQPYHNVCSECSKKMNICPKCEIKMKSHHPTDPFTDSTDVQVLSGDSCEITSENLSDILKFKDIVLEDKENISGLHSSLESDSENEKLSDDDDY